MWDVRRRINEFRRTLVSGPRGSSGEDNDDDEEDEDDDEEDEYAYAYAYMPLPEGDEPGDSPEASDVVVAGGGGCVRCCMFTQTGVAATVDTERRRRWICGAALVCTVVVMAAGIATNLALYIVYE